MTKHAATPALALALIAAAHLIGSITAFATVSSSTLFASTSTAVPTRHPSFRDAAATASVKCRSKRDDAAKDDDKCPTDAAAAATMTRRSALLSAAVSAGIGAAFLSSPLAVSAESETLERGGVPLTPFNSLQFQYRGNDNTGLDASTLTEPSISYGEFLDKLSKGDVEFVEFMAPNGDAAYATFKATEGEAATRIRIGQGYPIEDPEGWSSPAFVVKIVKKNNVPYKFTVPALASYK